MPSTDVVSKLAEAIEPEAEARGLELVAVEQSGGRGMPVIRVLLDCDGGIDLDTVAAANAWVSEIVDEADPFNHPYTLEVSSPGVDRPLVRRADFDRFAGQTVTVKTAGGPTRSSWTGVLVGMQGNDVVLTVDGEDVAVPFDTIHKARLKGEVDFKGKGRS